MKMKDKIFSLFTKLMFALIFILLLPLVIVLSVVRKIKKRIDNRRILLSDCETIENGSGVFYLAKKGRWVAAFKQNDDPANRTLVIPEGVEVIGQSAFRETDFDRIVFPEGLKRIMRYAFSGNRGLKEVCFPESLREIGHNAFSECIQLEEAYIPDNVELSESVFKKCVHLKKVRLPADLRCVPDAAFLDCRELVDVAIPDKVLSINAYAFLDCVSLPEPIFPPGLLTICQAAFVNCSFKKVMLPDKVKNIYDNAFTGCGNLREIAIPRNITYISQKAFMHCDNLFCVDIDGKMYCSMRKVMADDILRLLKVVRNEAEDNYAAKTFCPHIRLKQYMETKDEAHLWSLKKHMDELFGLTFENKLYDEAAVLLSLDPSKEQLERLTELAISLGDNQLFIMVQKQKEAAGAYSDADERFEL